MTRLSNLDRGSTIGKIDAGMRVRAIVAAHESCISHLRSWYTVTGSTADRSRSGRPRVTRRWQDRYIELQHLRDRLQTATQTARETPEWNNPHISDQTMRNRLRAVKLRCDVQWQIPVLPLLHNLGACTTQNKNLCFFFWLVYVGHILINMYGFVWARIEANV